MSKVASGKIVSIHYKLTLDDGQVVDPHRFDRSEGSEENRVQNDERAIDARTADLERFHRVTHGEPLGERVPPLGELDHRGDRASLG